MIKYKTTNRNPQMPQNAREKSVKKEIYVQNQLNQQNNDSFNSWPAVCVVFNN